MSVMEMMTVKAREKVGKKKMLKGVTPEKEFV